MFRTTPLEVRRITIRERFSSPVIVEASDYRIVQGFGNSLQVLSKIGEPSFLLPADQDKPLYPNRNGHYRNEAPLEARIIYQAKKEP